MKKIAFLSVLLLICFSSCAIDGIDSGVAFTTPAGQVLVSFSVASDMRDYTGCSADYFRGVCETLAKGGPGQFMVSAGDIDPPSGVYSAILSFFKPGYIWYPVVGNHEAETAADMEWLRDFNKNGTALPNIVRPGPPGCEETTYSFDYGNTHFVVLNEYYDGSSDHATDGDIPDALYDWLIYDLEAVAAAGTTPIVLVFGHEPAYPQPDQESGRLRHENDSLNVHSVNRDRFWDALLANGVTAYFCGHTHNYSAVKIGSGGVIVDHPSGVWQIDSGHARGTGDTGARSTFLMLYAMEDGRLWCGAYRLDRGANRYELTDFLQLR